MYWLKKIENLCVKGNLRIRLNSKKWCKENYESSVTGSVWLYTPYSAGWDKSNKHGEVLSSSSELKAIFMEEIALGVVSHWAKEIVERMLRPLPMCGHYTFPMPLLQICEAIREKRCPEFVIGCYTADSKRKLLMSNYVFCLNAWLKNAPLEIAKSELELRDSFGKDWSKIVTAIYNALGVPSQKKRLLLERLLHRLRWWLKTLIWFDDKRNKYMLDIYSGDVRGDEENYGNPPFGDPYFVELKLPEIKELSREICEAVNDGKKFLTNIEETWLCAPKVFRYLEKLILRIGSIDSGNITNNNISILQCEDTYPSFSSCKKWYASFMSSLTDWLEGEYEAFTELGDISPVKHWLVRILKHRLYLYEKHNPLRFVATKPGGKSGAQIAPYNI